MQGVHSQGMLCRAHAGQGDAVFFAVVGVAENAHTEAQVVVGAASATQRASLGGERATPVVVLVQAYMTSTVPSSASTSETMAVLMILSPPGAGDTRMSDMALRAEVS